MRHLFIDGNNLAARSKHAMSELSTTDGRKSGAVLGFLKGLSWCRNQTGISLNSTVVFWDCGRSQERIKIYPDYKAGRKMNKRDTPEEMEEFKQYHMQLEALHNILRCAGVRQVKVEGVEADDLISIFCNTVGGSKVIQSGDADFHQLYSPLVGIFDPKKGLLGLVDMEKKWGSTDIQKYVLIKAMIGDASDNIKGVPQIGKARASLVAPFIRLSRDPSKDYGWRIRRDGAPDEKQAVWVKKALKNRSIIKRNVSLMRLPPTWEDSHYSLDQAEEALIQWMDRPSMNRRSFIAALESYELNSILENMNSW